jgi:hypothetical protein
MMLSLSGARQISGNNVRISIFIRNPGFQPVNVKLISDTGKTPVLLHDFERGPLAMPRGGTSEQGTDRVNGLAIAANDPADVALPKLQFKGRGFSAGNFREHHLIGIFDQLSNDELKKFFHVASGVAGDVSVGITGVGFGSADACVAAAGAGWSCFLLFLSKLRTVSDG